MSVTNILKYLHAETDMAAKQVTFRTAKQVAELVTKNLSDKNRKEITDRIVRWKLTEDKIRMEFNPAKLKLLVSKLSPMEKRMVQTRLAKLNADYVEACSKGFQAYQRADLRNTKTTLSVPKSKSMAKDFLLREQTRLSLKSRRAACERMYDKQLAKRLYGKTRKPRKPTQHNNRKKFLNAVPLKQDQITVVNGHPIKATKTSFQKKKRCKLQNLQYEHAKVTSSTLTPKIASYKISTKGKFALLLKKHWLDKILLKGKIWEIRGSDTGKIGQTIFLANKASIYGETTLTRTFAVTTEKLKQNAHKHQIKDLDDVKYTSPHVWELRNTKRYEKPMPFKRVPGQMIWCRVKFQKNRFVQWGEPETEKKIVKQKSRRKSFIV